MRLCILWLTLTSLALSACSHQAENKLPDGFVYLKNIDPSIQQQMRYAGSNNIIGKALPGYDNATCILTKPAAEALKAAQTELRASNLSLMVYDCYRPSSASNALVNWLTTNNEKMKKRFYPQLTKKRLIENNFVKHSIAHSNGSSIDVTIVPVPMPQIETYIPGAVLDNCTEPYQKRFFDGSIDMGTGFDCLDPLSSPSSKEVSIVAQYNRHILRTILEKYGFNASNDVWWHFTLKREPYPKTNFNFPVK